MSRRALLLLVGAVLATGLAAAVRLGVVGGSADRDDAPALSAAEREALREELLQMERDDQVERTGAGLPPGTKLPPSQDYARMLRLTEILDAHGWPTHSLVGEQASSAAWLVAQHADFDVEFQERALALLTAAAEQGEADPTDAAYLADRVAVNRGQPQTYGSQVRCRDGEPSPATPIEDAESVDERRVEAGMRPLADYYAELAMMCAAELAEGQEAEVG